MNSEIPAFGERKRSQDNVQLYGSGGIVGALTFSGIVATAPAQNVAFQFRPVGGGTAVVQTYFTTSDGAFYLHGVPDGSYSVWIKPDKYLAVVVPVTVSGGNASGIMATLVGGDANNDNTVDIADFGLLVNSYNGDSSIAGSGYDVRADFNGDGIVDIADFGLLVNSYNQSGAL